MKQNLILLTVLLTALSAFSTEYFVDASRPDDSGAATNWATAKQTIQAAVDLATDGDTVLVTNGVYATGGAVSPPFDLYGDGSFVTSALMNRVCITNAITIRSVNGPEVTIIQGASNNGSAALRCVQLFPSALMDGFTLTGGKALSGSSRPDMAGGGAFLHTNAVMNRCIITGNSADVGGGVLILTNAVLNNCVLGWNSAGYEGGGVFCADGGTLNNCLLNGNTVAYVGGNGGNGGGAALYNGGGMLNCTVSGNSAAHYGGGVFMPMGGTLDNCIVWGNDGNNIDAYDAAIRNTCSSPLMEGEGNICAEPMFINGVNSNFQLQAGSPCINAGNNSTVSTTNDLAGNSRIIGGVVDMGAYENKAAGTDVDVDGMDDLWELNQFGGRHFAVPDTICSNGVNTILEAYIAGLDPNNAAARFKVEKYKADARNTLRWNAASGRVYSVYFSTNLLNGFQPVETNIPWTAGAFTDTVHSAQEQGYYKIGVELK